MINEKNDLMQDVSSESNNNMRKYLLIGGGVFVLFVIGIVVSKFLFSEPKKNNTAVILPPEVTVKQKKADTSLFNEIPVENETEFKKPEVTAQKEEIIPEPKIEKPVSKVEVKPKLEPMEKVDKKVAVKPAPKPKIVKKETKKVAVKDKKINKKYYIQVAATRGNPSKRFLKLITKNGFQYKIVDVTVKGVKVKRILVGGYATYKDVKKALPEVKKKISSSAFVKVLK